MVFSGAAFMGNPMSEEVSMPNISLTKSAPEVASGPGDEGVIGLVPEPTFTSGHMNEEEEEEGEVKVNCTDLRSTITMEESVRIAAR